ncbi:sensor histidine kinase [Saccharibacter sp. 17.LH.SD]|uniref:sensor histidine kinase n=1 Tax=Saccharibacter sp. 17.LH.SD TaxID=2689393 RepID=UPI00136A1073|nr:ATP-binding protein [Saccharibacter sp. 17.LH.SD]MXV44872.1 sensor histidine kinase [Saccharibacter sp. 17.LH.SD]
MRVIIGTLIQIGGIVSACLLAAFAWERRCFVTTVVMVCVGILCAVLLIIKQLELQRRIQRKEVSVVPPEDSEKLLNRALIDHAPVLLLFQRTDGTIYAANRAARTVFKVQGKILAPPAALIAVLESGSNALNHSVIQLPSLGGSLRTYAVSIAQGGGMGGIRVYLALLDIEARMNTAEAKALRDLLQILSHEIMNSLTPIISLSAMAEDLLTELPDKGQSMSELLSTIRRRADGLEHFVRGYRDLARLPAPNLKPVDFRELLCTTATLFEARWAECPVLELILPPTHILVHLDRVQMEQALLNLLNNSAEATLEMVSPRVQLVGVWDNGVASIFVRDNGSGVDPTQRDHIFEPFMSFKKNGNGIGLSLARQIVLGHGGALTLENKTEFKEWTTEFSIRL